MRNKMDQRRKWNRQWSDRTRKEHKRPNDELKGETHNDRDESIVERSMH